MADAIVVGKALLSAGRLVVKVTAKLQELGPTARLREAQEIDARSWRAMRDAEIERRLSALEATDTAGDVADRVEAMVADHQFTRLHRNLEFEAAREATGERRRMLAHLAAGLTDPDMTINQKARIERTIRTIDPEDLEVLREVRERRFPTAGEQERHFSHFSASMDVLVNAGCIRRRAGVLSSASSTEVFHVTEIGVQLLGALESFQRNPADG